MLYNNLFKENKKVKLGILGATKGYGLTVLSQIKNVEKIQLRVISSRSLKDCKKILLDIGYDSNRIVECENVEELSNINENDIIITTNINVLLKCGITSFIECTGNVELGVKSSEYALKNNINVYMVSKETDSVCGVYLNHIALENGTVYSLVNGDQPRNAIDLYSWAKINGFNVIALGKSSEYDFVWDRETGDITYTDGSNKYSNMPDMMDYWRFNGKETLEGRKKLLKEYIGVISADLCEMNVISNITKFKPSDKFLNYPVIKTSELADVLIPEEDGGILKDTEVLDVFFQLREKDEASFAGGEFVIVKCENKEVWDLLKSKGHIVGKNNKYACVIQPFHLMGLETPISILLGDLKGIGGSEDCRQVSVMSAFTNRDFKKGETLEVSGHHHSIEGIVPSLLPIEQSSDMAPFYLLNNAILKNDIKKGEFIKLEDVEIKSKEGLRAYNQALKLK